MKTFLRHLSVLLALSAAVQSCAPEPVFATVSNTTVSTTTAYGNGSTTTFSIGFDFRSNSWLNVVLWDTSTNPATQTTIAQGSGSSKYTVSGGNPGTAIVMGTAPTTTQYLVITRVIPLTQPVVFNPASIFPYAGLSSQVDQITLELQNLNAGIGGSSGGGGGGGGGANEPSGYANNFWAWNTSGSSVINVPGNQSTFNLDDVIAWNGSSWGVLNMSPANITGYVNNASGTSQVSPGAGGTGASNTGDMTWGHAINWTTTGTTNLTLPSSGTLIAGTTNTGNVANTIPIRDSSGNFSSNVITANSFVGPVTGAVTGNVTGNASGTSANVTGTVAIGHGGTGATTQQAALNALAGGVTSGDFIRCNGTNCGLSTLQTGDVPQGFSRLKLAQTTANTLLTNDGSGNMSTLPGGTAGYVATFNGTTWVSGPVGSGLPGIFPFGTDTGTADHYVVASTNPPITALQPGIGVSFVATNSNTGASDLNVASLGAKNILTGDGAALSANDIVTGQMVILGYDGTEWQLLGGGAGTPGGSNTDVQYNNAGAFGGSGAFTTDGAGDITLSGQMQSATIVGTGLTASKPVFTTAGKALSSGSVTGNTTEIVTGTGTYTSGHGTSIDSNGNVIDSGVVALPAAIPSPTVAESGDVVGVNGSGAFTITPFNMSTVSTGILTVPHGGTGVATATAHGIIISEGTSAFDVVGPAGTSGTPFCSAGASADPAYCDLAVNVGGTGRVTLGANGVLIGEGTSAVNSITDSSAGQPLLSGGTGVDPTFGAVSLSGIGVTGTLPIANGGTNSGTANGGFNNLSPTTTKGDTIIYSTVNARQAVPADYAALIPDSGQTNGWRGTATYSQLQDGRPGKNYIQYADFENGNAATGWSLGTIGTLTNGLPTGSPTFGSGASGNLSIATEGTANNLAGNYSLGLVSSAATTQGNMVASSAYSIDQEDQAKVFNVNFYYGFASGVSNVNLTGTSSNSYAWAVYDVTNSVWLTTTGNFCMYQGTGMGHCTGTLQTGASTASIRFVVYNANATAGAATLLLDDVYVGPQSYSVGPAMTDMATYTPTLSSMFGTTSNNKAYYKRIGDHLFVQGFFTMGTRGTSTFATISLPTGLSIDSTKLSTVNSTSAAGQLVGYSVQEGSSGVPIINELVTAPSTSTTVIYYGPSTANATVPQLTPTSVAGNLSFYSSTNISYSFSVPIAGWSSNSNLSQDTDTRVVAAAMTGATASVTSAYSDVTWTTVANDTHGAMGAINYTIPVTGYYSFSGQIYASAATITAGQNFFVSLFNTTSSTTLRETAWIYQATNTTSQAIPFRYDQILLSAGTQVKIQVKSSDTTPAITSSATQNFLSISRTSGPAVVAASEKVYLLYTGNGGGSLTSGTTNIDFDTKVVDSHGAWSGTNTFTAPRSGFCTITGNVKYTTSAAADVYVYLNTTKSYYTSGAPAGAAFKGVAAGLYLNAGDVVNFRADASATLSNSATDHWISIFCP